MHPPLTILYEDNHCLAVAKPAPLLTQGVSVGVASLEAQVKEYLRGKYAKVGRVYLGIPHRLDRPVSGVVVFARQTKSAQRLAEQFQKRQVTKIYWGAVEGEVSSSEGVWEDWLVKDANQSRASVAAANAVGARQATTRYRRLEAVPGGAVLELNPQTGRMHQLRVQSAARGWPIRGDSWYDAKMGFGQAASESRERVIALHARSLTFLHPIRFEPITVVAALPDYWNELGITEEMAARWSQQPCADVSP